jgi:serine protease Do
LDGPGDPSYGRRCVTHALVVLFVFATSLTAAPLTTVIPQVQPKQVKIYGAGGYRGLEAYQSGSLISATGHVLTVWSYVLDTDFITVTLHDGRKFEGKHLAADPRLDIAVLKIEAQNLPHFEVAKTALVDAGTRVLAFSNLYGVATGDEPVSVQRGVVSVRSRLHARRGVYETPYKGQAYILDAMTNNPGAAGGALTDYDGRLLGILGKELRNSQNNTWLNYAIPIPEAAKTIEDIVSGKYVNVPTEDVASKPKQPLSLELLGIQLVPDVLPRTPPYIDRILPGSPAASTGLRPDDLVLFVNGRLTAACTAVRTELEYIDRIDPVSVTVLRNQELIDVQLRAAADANP